MVTQEDDMGCGAACVAYLSNKTYLEAVNILGRNKAKTVGFKLKELVDGLNYFGLRYEFKYVKPKIKHLIYHDGAIVFIKRSARYPYGHYLVRKDGLWADPWLNLVLDKTLMSAKSGYRKRLPGTAQWVVVPKK